MKIEGVITKMIVENADIVQYYWKIGGEILMMNELLEKKISVEKTGYQCLNCGKNKEIFAMGFCSNCFNTSPAANQNIFRPELSTAHLGIEKRDLEWEKKLELQPHIVYLANTGEVKVGVTRETQIPTRWIDQGAEQVIKLAKTNNRYEAGMIEVELKNHAADKTNYRKMLSGNAPILDLQAYKKELITKIPPDFSQFIVEDDTITNLKYPILYYPPKINSISLKKNSLSDGILTGIKGQYLIFRDSRVINIRSHEGFVVKLEVV